MERSLNPSSEIKAYMLAHQKLLIIMASEMYEVSNEYEQFPEAMCDITVASVLQNPISKEYDLMWIAGMVYGTQHFWIWDQTHDIFLDPTVKQFPQICTGKCRIGIMQFESCPILVGSREDFQKLGYEWGDEAFSKRAKAVMDEAMDTVAARSRHSLKNPARRKPVS